MELRKNKSAWAALATLGVTAVAAGATAFVKIREKRRERREQDEQSELSHRLTAEQQMVYNEAVRAFLALNDRIYELRRHRDALQPVVRWLAAGGEQPQVADGDEAIQKLVADVAHFLTSQQPFINACLGTVEEDGMHYTDCVRGAVGGCFDPTLDEEPTGADVAEGTAIKYVLKLGYYFPGSIAANQPVKSIVVV